MNPKYAEIIHREAPTSKTHPRMSMANRAAQFAPFAALTGHDEAIKETAQEQLEEVESQLYTGEVEEGC